MNELHLVINSSRTIQREIKSIPSSTTLVKAIYMVKSDWTDPDSEALITKEITTASGDDGQIIDAGGGDGIGVVQFTIDNDDVGVLLAREIYVAAIKVFLNNGLSSVPLESCEFVRVFPSMIEAVD